MAAPLLLIDSYSQIYRGYYAIRALTTAQGIPSNAVFAMTKLLMKLKEEYEGYEGAFVFDKGRPAQRMALAPAYKANRPPMPDDLRSQLEIIRDMIHAFGWNIIEWDGAEADDLIAAAAANFTDRKVLIVSSDKDISQVIDERVEMLVPDHDGKGFTRRGIEETIAKFGVKPSAIVDYLALIGDSSDNIPGVEGVGPKTAAALLNQFDSIDDMLARVDEIKRESLREKIRASAEVMRLNQKLILLDKTIPEGLALTEDSFRRNLPDYRKITELTSRMELKSILRELEKQAPAVPVPPQETQSTQLEFNF